MIEVAGLLLGPTTISPARLEGRILLPLAVAAVSRIGALLAKEVR